MKRHFWTDEKRAEVARLAGTGMIAPEIATALGATHASILTYCGRHGIPVIKYSPEQQAMYDRRALDRETTRQARKVAANKKKKLAQRLAAMERSGHAAAVIAAASSQTSVGYRAHLPPAPDMTKNQMREMFAQAVRNTAEIAI